MLVAKYVDAGTVRNRRGSGPYEHDRMVPIPLRTRSRVVPPSNTEKAGNGLLPDILREPFDRRCAEWTLIDPFKAPSCTRRFIEEDVDGPMEELKVPSTSDLET
jgi:hypothetical protein